MKRFTRAFARIVLALSLVVLVCGFGPPPGRRPHRLFSLAPGRTWVAFYQSGYGMTEGATLLATGTTPPAITFSGTRTGRPYPIWVKCNTTGGARGTWTGDVYYDGTGTTSEQSFTSAATVALTGKGAGLTLNIPTGNAATDNVWKATLATWSDLASTHDMVQATAANQPVITTGLNGFPGVACDGSNDNLVATGLNLVAPGTTNIVKIAIFRQLGWTSAKRIFGETSSGSAVIAFQTGASPSLSQFNTSTVNANTAATINTWVRGRWFYSNSTSDYQKLGATNVTGANAGNSNANGQELCSGAGTNFANVEFLAFGIATGGDLTAADIAGFDAAETAIFAGGVAN